MPTSSPATPSASPATTNAGARSTKTGEAVTTGRTEHYAYIEGVLRRPGRHHGHRGRRAGGPGP